MKYYSAIKKKEILPFAKTCMGFEHIMLSEISQTEKDKYHMISFICGIKRKKNLNSCIQRRDWWWPEPGHGAWTKRMKVVKRYKLPVIK